MTPSTFVKNEQGLYRVKGAVKPDEIVRVAAEILLEKLLDGEALTCPADTVQFLQMALGNALEEQFCVLFLNSRHQVLAFEALFTGTIDRSAVHPRVVVQRALACNAAAVILAHNHPSQDCEPSRSDREITERLVEALGLMDIRVLDHFVVSATQWMSLAERGWL